MRDHRRRDCLQFMETGDGRILVKFGDRIKDFHVHVIYASDSLIYRQSGGPESFPRRLVRNNRLYARPPAADDRRCRQTNQRLSGRCSTQAMAHHADPKLPTAVQPKGAGRAGNVVFGHQGAAVETRYVDAVDGSIFARNDDSLIDQTAGSEGDAGTAMEGTVRNRIHRRRVDRLDRATRGRSPDSASPR